MNDPEAEVVDLVSIEHLHGKDLREIDDAALDLDKHGHEVSAVYRETPDCSVTGTGTLTDEGCDRRRRLTSPGEQVRKSSGDPLPTCRRPPH